MESSPAEMTPRWHSLPIEEVADRLGSTPSGLGAAQASRRLEEVGPNELQEAHRRSPFAILLEQFKNLLIIILLAATLLSAFLGEEIEAIAIAVIVLFAVILGFAQEYRAERAIEALRRMAALTGESVPSEKRTDPLADAEPPLGDRKNMAYAGTAVTYGRGSALVVATGMNTEFGAIARMLQTIETAKTPLQRNLDRVGASLARIAFAIVALIVALGLLRGQPFLEMLIFGIALAVAVVPEALPAVVTISLALGVQRMVRRSTLMRRLPAVETLGSTTYICTDKTGTLTKDEMTARRLWIGGATIEISGAGYEPVGQLTRDGSAIDLAEGGWGQSTRRLLRAAALACDATIDRSGQDGRWAVKGDPTEGAIAVAAAKAGLDKGRLDADSPRLAEIPFTSESKRMTVRVGGPDPGSYSKGAPEVILASCDRWLGEGGEAVLDGSHRERIFAAAASMAAEALRVLAVADKPGAEGAGAERGMILLGLVGMIDPPRPEARTAIATCREAGIKPVMITGDHPATAQAVGRELGLLLLSLIVYLPVLHLPFGTFALGPGDLLIIFLLAFSVSPVLELAKWFVRRGWLGRSD